MIPTAKFSKADLMAARNAAGLSRVEVSSEVGVSPETVRRWETPGEANPGPDDVFRLEKLYKTPGIWHLWMQSHYDSYREMYPEAIVDYSLPMAIVNIRHQVTDMLRLQDAIERDAMDGRIDDQGAKARYKAELTEIQAAITQALSKID